MKKIETQIEIAAPPEKVWQVLTDFARYPDWNPFLKKISGKAQAGEKLSIFAQPDGASGIKFSPVVLKAESNRELRWMGKLFFGGLFDGEHYFEIKPINQNKTIFIHGEIFKGILVALLWRFLGENTERSYKLMNEALKNRTESLNLELENVA